jgi:hypothetical protein
VPKNVICIPDALEIDMRPAALSYVPSNENPLTQRKQFCNLARVGLSRPTVVMSTQIFGILKGRSATTRGGGGAVVIRKHYIQQFIEVLYLYGVFSCRSLRIFPAGILWAITGCVWEAVKPALFQDIKETLHKRTIIGKLPVQRRRVASN